MSEASETSRARPRLLPYCAGAGLDIGFGGDPIAPSAICFDLPRPYTSVGESPQHLAGDCRNLPFRDRTLDYVYSSHLLEDFIYSDQAKILNEWARVVRFGGRIVLLGPDQARFEAHCAATGQPLNLAHKEPDLSWDKFFNHVLRFVNFKFRLAYHEPHVDDYSWECVLERR